MWAENKEFERQYLAGELELESIPRARLGRSVYAAGGADYGFYTKSARALWWRRQETRTVDGESYVLETGLTADVSLVKAWKGDTRAILVYRKTRAQLQSQHGTAARVTVAEVEELVEPGSSIRTAFTPPGIFRAADHSGARYTKLIEKRTVRSEGEVECRVA